MGQFENKALQAFAEKLDAQGVQLPLSEHTEVLAQPLAIGAHTMHNRIAVQPMEGCDGTADGRPAEPTIRRYMRFARGGAGLIWFEATAVCREGRANPRQLWLTPETLDDFRRLADQIREEAVKANGYAPLLILQATHSGRYSKPEGRPDPLIAYNNPLFEGDKPIPAERIVPDEYLDRLVEQMGKAAALAEKAGFDGVDIKSCHRYLASELLSAYTRPGRYGGSFENRTRFLRSAVQAAKQETGSDFIVTSRLNVYDGFPYPYGFGVAEGGGLTPDLSEPERLVSLLCAESGLKLLDVTIGNPYVNPHVNRPANHYPYACGESPLTGLARMVSCVSAIQKSAPDLAVIGSGLSYPGAMAPYLAAGGVEQGCFAVAGFGRASFAYPDFPRDILQKGAVDAARCCVACGKCSELMRAGSIAGCVVRDSAYYLPYYKRDVLKKEG